MENTTFQDNKAETGAALYMSDSFLLLNFSSFQFRIINNFANAYGGAIFVDFLLSNVNRSQCYWLLYIPMMTSASTLCIILVIAG